METLTVETVIDSGNVPTSHLPAPALFQLQTDTARSLLNEGCSEESITFSQSRLIDGRWTLRGKGVRP